MKRGGNVGRAGCYAIGVAPVNGAGGGCLRLPAASFWWCLLPIDYKGGKYPQMWDSGGRGELGKLCQLASKCGIVGVRLGAFE